MRRDPLTVGVSVLADALKINAWKWLAVLAAFAVFVGAFQVFRTGTAVPTPTPARPLALSFIRLTPQDWRCERDGARMKFSGQVTNANPTESMLMVKLAAELFDRDNRSFANDVGFVQEQLVPPNGLGHFAFFVADADQRTAGCRLTVQEAVYP